jgi:hypothetical protein
MLPSFTAAGPADAQAGQPLRLASNASPRVPTLDGSASPDMLQAIGEWFDRSVQGLNTGLHEGLVNFRQLGDHTRDAMSDAAAVAGAAATSTANSIATLPRARIIRRRELCPRAPNGGPDCVHAAVLACRASGFSGGSTVEVQSEEKCPVEVMMGQRRRQPGDCTTDTYIVQSLCQ